MTIRRCICGHPDGYHVNLRGECMITPLTLGEEDCTCESFIADTSQNRAGLESISDVHAIRTVGHALGTLGVDGRDPDEAEPEGGT